MKLLSHTHDAETSRKAAAIAEGRATNHAAKIYKLLTPLPTLTASDLTNLLDGDCEFSYDWFSRLFQIRRRLSDLKRLGLATNSGEHMGESLWSRM